MPVADMVGSIRGNDIARLTKIPGIGKKTAERMVVDLRDKLEKFGAPQSVAAVTPVEDDVLSALMNLGYQRPVAERALAVAARNGGAANFDQLFRDALAALSK